MILKYVFIVTVYAYTGANAEAEDFVIETGLTRTACADMIARGVDSVPSYNGKTRIWLENKPISFTCEVDVQPTE